jgi:glycosyltransferase involved in cell wall biosynthesis
MVSQALQGTLPLKEMRICMFSYYFPPQYSGAALQAISLAKKLKARGVETAFLTANHDNLPATDEIDGFTVYRVSEKRGKYGEALLWRNMWRLLRREKTDFDIIHSHGAYLRNSFIGLLSRVLRKKSIVKVSLADNDLHGLGKGKSGWLHKKFITMIDRYVSISKEITDELMRYGFARGKIWEIPNGVDTERFAPVNEGKTLLRKKYGLPEESLMLLYVGVVDERKNVKWLIEEWERLSPNYPGFLVVVGPVSREDRDLSLYKSLKDYENTLRGKLFMIQYTDWIEDFYRMADMFILPSMNEGMPNVILEAMSTGLPCLANKVSGAEDIINGENGLLFDIRVPHTFVKNLQRLKDKSERSKIGSKARQTILNKYSLDYVADQYIELYKEMLKG